MILFFVCAAGLAAFALFSKTSRKMWFASGVSAALVHDYGCPDAIADSLVVAHRDAIEQQRRAGNSKQIVAGALWTVHTALEEQK